MQHTSTANATHRKWAIRVGFLLGILTFLSSAFAQGGGNVAITGNVTDTTGAVLPGVRSR
jgi:type 1 fimbria pilin